MTTTEIPTPPTGIKREPVLSIGSIAALVTAMLDLAVVLGLDLPAGFEAALLAVITAVGPIIGAVITRTKTAPIKAVTEYVKDGIVLAGPASELATGTPVREAGDLYYDYTDPEVQAAHEQTHRADD